MGPFDIGDRGKAGNHQEAGHPTDTNRGKYVSSMPPSISYHYHYHQLHSTNANACNNNDHNPANRDKSKCINLNCDDDDIMTAILTLKRRVTTRLKPWSGAKSFEFKHSPGSFHGAFWEWVQNERPDSILIRCLKLHKWNANHTMEVLTMALEWRMSYGFTEFAVMDEEALGQ